MRWQDRDGEETINRLFCSEMELYRTLFGDNYAAMVREFPWVDKILNSEVAGAYSDGSRP